MAALAAAVSMLNAREYNIARGGFVVSALLFALPVAMWEWTTDTAFALAIGVTALGLAVVGVDLGAMLRMVARKSLQPSGTLKILDVVGVHLTAGASVTVGVQVTARVQNGPDLMTYAGDWLLRVSEGQGDVFQFPFHECDGQIQKIENHPMEPYAGITGNVYFLRGDGVTNVDLPSGSGFSLSVSDRRLRRMDAFFPFHDRGAKAEA